MERQRDTTVSASGYVRDSYQANGTYMFSEPGTVPSYLNSNELINETQRGRPHDNDVYHRYETAFIYRTVNSFPWTYNTSGNAYNPGDDYKTQTNDYAQLYWLDANVGGQTLLTSAPYGVYGYKDLPLTIGDPLNGTDLNYLSEAAIQSLLPLIQPDTSILNSLYELKDFKRLPGLLSRVRHFFFNFPKIWRTSRSGTLRQLTRMSSEGYLSDQFAIRPLIRDITELIGVGRTLDNQLRKLVENAGKVRHKYYTREVPDLVPVLDESVELTRAYFFKPRIRRTVSQGGLVPRFTAGITYSYTLPDINIGALRRRLVSKRLGVELNPQIVWNAIPWTFVVDWFLNINELLGEFSKDSLGIQTAIHRYVYSIKFRRVVETYIKLSSAGPFNTDYVKTRTGTETVYSRRAGIPDLTRHLEVTGLNWKQFSYIGALIGARL